MRGEALGGELGRVEQLALQSLIKRLGADPRQFAMLIGAGVSVSAGIPLGSGVVQHLRIRYPERFRPDRAYDYPDAFDAALPGPQHRNERRALFERLCAGKVPTDEHQMLAHLADRGVAPILFTTNFDHLIETALMARSAGTRVYLHDRDVDPAESAKGGPLLLKLHGDFLFEDLANLEDEVRAKMTRNMRSKVLTFLRGRGLVVLGYGGNDASIMGLLGEAVADKECLTQGLWWVFFHPEDVNHGPVQRLARRAARHGRRLHLVGPLSAARFLAAACRNTGVGLPSPIPFGVNPKRGSLLSGYVGRFARERQLPANEARLSKSARSAAQLLARQLQDPGVVMLLGPPRSGKSGVIASLATNLGDRPFFYFSHRFARTPIHASFDLDLWSLAGAAGVEAHPETPAAVVLDRLLQRDAVFAFDDLLALAEIHRPYLDRIIAVIHRQAATASGSVVLAFSMEPTPGFLHGIVAALSAGEQEGANGNWEPAGGPSLQVIHLGRKGDDENERARLTKRLSGMRTENPALWRALRSWSIVRRAEPSQFFGEVSMAKGSDTSRVVHGLTRSGLMESRNRRYIIRAHVQEMVDELYPPSTRDQLRVAKACERASAQSEYFDRAHYALEAEAHYWAGADYEASLRQLLPVTDSLIGIGSARFLYLTLLELLEEPSVVKELEPSTRVALLNSFYRAWRETSPPDLEIFPVLFPVVLDLAMASMDEAWQALLGAQHAEINGDVQLNGRYLRHAERLLRSSGPSSDLGRAQLAISGWAHSAIEWGASAETVARRLQDALVWARRAERTFSAVRDSNGVGRARDNATAALLRSGRYEEALALQEQQIGIYSDAPGFTRDKAVMYGNLFQASLCIGRIREAEGYFYQSMLNFSNVKDSVGVLRNALFLFEHGLNWDQPRGSKLLPSPRAMYLSIRTAAMSVETSSNAPMVRELMDRLCMTWLRYQVRWQHRVAAARALGDFLAAARRREPVDALPVALAMIALLGRGFGIDAVQVAVRAAMREGAAWSHGPCQAYADWLQAPRRPLAPLLISRGVDEKWEDAMRLSWRDSRTWVGHRTNRLSR